MSSVILSFCLNVLTLYMTYAYRDLLIKKSPVGGLGTHHGGCSLFFVFVFFVFIESTRVKMTIFLF